MSFTVFKVCFSITVSDGWSQAVPSFFSLLCLCSEQAFLISIMVHSWCNNILPRMALRAPPVPTHSSSTTRQAAGVLCSSKDQYETSRYDSIHYTTQRVANDHYSIPEIIPPVAKWAWNGPRYFNTGAGSRKCTKERIDILKAPCCWEKKNDEFGQSLQGCTEHRSVFPGATFTFIFL